MTSGFVLQVCNSQDQETFGLTQSGKVLMWLNNTSKIKLLDNFVGIAVKIVACAPNVHLICMVTDRGILMTKGAYIYFEIRPLEGYDFHQTF